MKEFWITKYALTTGIFSVKCDVYVASPEVTYTSGPDIPFCRIGTDAFETEAEAKKDAVKRAKRKLVSLEKKRKVLESIIQTLG